MPKYDPQGQFWYVPGLNNPDGTPVRFASFDEAKAASGGGAPAAPSPAASPSTTTTTSATTTAGDGLSPFAKLTGAIEQGAEALAGQADEQLTSAGLGGSLSASDIVNGAKPAKGLWTPEQAYYALQIYHDYAPSEAASELRLAGLSFTPPVSSSAGSTASGGATGGSGGGSGGGGSGGSVKAPDPEPTTPEGILKAQLDADQITKEQYNAGIFDLQQQRNAEALQAKREEYESQGMKVVSAGEGVLRVYDPKQGKMFNAQYVPQRGRVEESARVTSAAARMLGFQNDTYDEQGNRTVQLGTPAGATLSDGSEAPPRTLTLSPDDAARLAMMRPAERSRELQKLTGRALTIAEEVALLGVPSVGGNAPGLPTPTGPDYQTLYDTRLGQLTATGLSPEDADYGTEVFALTNRLDDQAYYAQPRAAGLSRASGATAALEAIGGYELDEETGTFSVNAGIDPATGETRYKDLSQSEAAQRARYAGDDGSSAQAHALRQQKIDEQLAYLRSLGVMRPALGVS